MRAPSYSRPERAPHDGPQAAERGAAADGRTGRRLDVRAARPGTRLSSGVGALVIRACPHSEPAIAPAEAGDSNEASIHYDSDSWSPFRSAVSLAQVSGLIWHRLVS